MGDQYESWIVRRLVVVWFGDWHWPGYVSKMLVGCGTRRWDCTLYLNCIVGPRWIEYGCGLLCVLVLGDDGVCGLVSNGSWGGVLNVGCCVNGTEGGSSMGVWCFKYGCMRGWVRWYLGGVLNVCCCVGVVFLNFDHGVHLGSDNYSLLLFQILAAF